MFWVALTAIASAAGTAMTVLGQRQAAKAELQAAAFEQEASRVEAIQMRQQAGQERANASMQSARMQRGRRVMESRQRVAMGGSGFRTDDVGASKMRGDLIKEASMQELLMMAQAEDTAQQLEWGADVKERYGRQAVSAGRMRANARMIDANAALLTGVSSWANLYGDPRTWGSKTPSKVPKGGSKGYVGTGPA